MKKRTAAIAAMMVLAALACGDGVSMVGDAMVDAGEALLDAGHELGDAGDAMTADASAQERVMIAACDQEVVASRVTRRADGVVTSEHIQYFAEATFPGLSPETVTSAFAVQCDREVFGVSPATCGAESTCEANQPEPFDCTTGTPEIDGSRVRVSCGYRLTYRTTADGSATVVGERRQSVRFVIQ